MLASFIFAVAIVTPGFVHAQTQGDGTSSWVDRFLGGSTGPSVSSDNGTPVIPGSVTNILNQFLGGSSNADSTQGNTGGYVNVGGAFNLNTVTNLVTNAFNNPLGTIGDAIQGGLNLAGTFVNGAISFVENPFSSTVNGIVGAYVEFGNQTGLWGNSSISSTIYGDPGLAGESIVNAIVEGIVDITNEILNANSDPGTPATPERAQPADPSGAGKGSTRPADTRGHNPSGLGGLGSPSNPLSTGESDTSGANSDDIGTNNVQTQTSPYLFEPVPGGENNAGGHEN